ncbi:MAG: RNA pseudouridine synthase, partial [Erysipelotrichaceae bacterium]|nr:RNA pseudouridine synthase [Erysipelotrichaceae bacterium]
MKRLEENDDLIVIIKPPGISSQGKDSLETQLSEELNTTIYPVHRLDQPVGGVMVYAKNEKMAAYLSKQIQDHTFEKTYLAIIEGQMEDKGTLEDLLYH